LTNFTVCDLKNDSKFKAVKTELNNIAGSNLSKAEKGSEGKHKANKKHPFFPDSWTQRILVCS